MVVPAGDDLTTELPTDVKHLIGHFIRSVGHLETLLYLFQNQTRAWSSLELSRELRTNEAYADHQLVALAPLVEKKDGSYRYASEPELDLTVEKLADLYRERRHLIINTIYFSQRPSDALRSFAEAFRIKKD